MKRLISVFLLVAFIVSNVFPQGAMAQVILPAPDVILPLGASVTPPVLKGMVIHPDEPFKFDFLMDTGTNKVQGEALRQEADKAVRYFLSSLTVPEEEQWVNLSPVEPDRIIPDGFGQTVMGRDLLGEDYILKQLSSSLLHPDSETGKAFWARIYETAAAKGLDAPSTDAFNRVWIVPSEARVWENNGKVIIIKSRLKVMLEADYLASTGKGEGTDPKQGMTDIYREVLIPVLEKEVNEGAHFAQLRQIYSAMILASWYKIRLKESVLGRGYADKNKTPGVGFLDTVDKEVIYKEYLASVQKGAYNFIREDTDIVTGATIPRRYFSGGFMNKVAPLLIAGGIFIGSLTLLAPAVRADVEAATVSASNVVLLVSGASNVPVVASSGLAGETQSAPEELKVGNWYFKMPLGGQIALWAGVAGALAVGGYGVSRWNKRRQLRIAEEKKRLEIEKLLEVINSRDSNRIDILDKKRALEVLIPYWQERQRAVNEQFLKDKDNSRSKDRLTLWNMLKPDLHKLACFLEKEGWHPSDLRDAFDFYLFLDSLVSEVSMRFLVDNQDAIFNLIEENKNRALAIGSLLHPNQDNMVLAECLGDLLKGMMWSKKLSVKNYEYGLNFLNEVMGELINVTRANTIEDIYDPTSETKSVLDLYGNFSLLIAISLKKSEYYRWNIKLRFGGSRYHLEIKKLDFSQAQDKNTGGIDLNSKKLDMQIDVAEKSAPMIINGQPINMTNIHGLTPVIYRIEPVNLPQLLELNSNPLLPSPLAPPA